MTGATPLRVVYIAGVGRSGSTLLSRLLGACDGFVNIGEGTGYLFNDRLASRNLPCGCGANVPDCEFWSPLFSRIPSDVRTFGTARIRMRHFVSLWLWPGLHRSRMQALQTSVTRMLTDVRERNRDATIVDASKNPTFGLLLSQLPGVRLHVIHVVRDPRAVVRSWSRPKGYLRRWSLWRVVAWWWVSNLLSECLRFRSSRYLLLRYEDFVARPRSALATIVAAVGAGACEDVVSGDGRVRPGLQHSLAGNPEKAEPGEITIRPAAAPPSTWRDRLALWSTWPLRWRYGYGWQRGAS